MASRNANELDWEAKSRSYVLKSISTDNWIHMLMLMSTTELDIAPEAMEFLMEHARRETSDAISSGKVTVGDANFLALLLANKPHLDAARGDVPIIRFPTWDKRSKTTLEDVADFMDSSSLVGSHTGPTKSNIAGAPPLASPSPAVVARTGAVPGEANGAARPPRPTLPSASKVPNAASADAAAPLTRAAKHISGGEGNVAGVKRKLDDAMAEGTTEEEEDGQEAPQSSTSVRVGPEYQATLPQLTENKKYELPNHGSEFSEMIWSAYDFELDPDAFFFNCDQIFCQRFGVCMRPADIYCVLELSYKIMKGLPTLARPKYLERSSKQEAVLELIGAGEIRCDVDYSKFKNTLEKEVTELMFLNVGERFIWSQEERLKFVAGIQLLGKDLDRIYRHHFKGSRVEHRDLINYYFLRYKQSVYMHGCGWNTTICETGTESVKVDPSCGPSREQILQRLAKCNQDGFADERRIMEFYLASRDGRSEKALEQIQSDHIDNF
eukprot:CAMPEP_0184694808 /NCGR_PEP_ID=MMETSP0313-20130426/2653_1 /TAXON_ID=2792 /ORGANISM="Porphyridium aerugineum, Strain SAG 1380-2" /LENGTH=495 /DNA_ID=CAMNT_0027153159 /DNA_START=107 /DNA_END=1594 /DNA_ORIENTATION=-